MVALDPDKRYGRKPRQALILRDFIEWRTQPALVGGLAVTFGAALALGHPWILVPVLACAATLSARELFPYLLALLMVFGVVQQFYLFPAGPTSGTVRFSVDDVTAQRTQFSSGWRVSGTCSMEGVALRVPTVSYLPTAATPPRPGCTYAIEGLLRPSGRPHSYQLKTVKGATWTLVHEGWSLAPWRHDAKAKLTDYIHERIRTPGPAALLAGLLTGEFDDPMARMEFGRLGLQHVMAISGFHFAIVAAVLGGLLRPLSTRRVHALLMLLVLSGYFIFVGPSPSIARAWIAVVVIWIGQLCGLHCTSLNAFGIGLLWVILGDPLAVEKVGFIFSFAATSGILLLQSPVDTAMRSLLKRRYLGQVIELPWAHQHLILIGGWLRQALSLTVAVHLVVGPLMLAMFHKFSLLSLLYNLFYPFLVSIAIMMLLIGFLVPPLDIINRHYCDILLEIVYQAPESFDLAYRIREVPTWLLFLYLTGVVAYGLRTCTLRFKEIKC